MPMNRGGLVHAVGDGNAEILPSCRRKSGWRSRRYNRKYLNEKYAAISTPTNVTTIAVPHSKASRQPIVLPNWSPEAPF